jgi:hypothetical protein
MLPNGTESSTAGGRRFEPITRLTGSYVRPVDRRDMNSYGRYVVGLCLQVVGLLNVVFLVGVPIWWAGRRLCRDARR